MGFTDLEKLLYEAEYLRWKSGTYSRMRLERAIAAFKGLPESTYRTPVFEEQIFIDQITARKQSLNKG